MYKRYREYLSGLHNTSKYRQLQPRDQGHYLDFSTNDYLNLSRNAEVIDAAIYAAETYGTGATGARLLSGNLKFYEEFEQTIARDKHTEDSLIFNSGFQANVSTLSALVDLQVLGEKPIVFFDMLNHSSLYQAVFLSKPELVRYNTLEQLEKYLIEYKNNLRPKFIVTETVFGMDGHIVDLEKIINYAKQHKAFLYLDEAHATGVLGKNGYGLSTDFKLNSIPHLIMGTFSKAIGVSGSYIACSKIIKEYLVNKASGFIYTTAPSPMVVAAAYKSWTLLKELDKERERLKYLSQILRNSLISNSFDIGKSQTHITPIIVRDEQICLDLKEKLLQEKIIVSSIRPPTVPLGSSRLRIALTVEHTEDDIARLVKLLNLMK